MPCYCCGKPTVNYGYNIITIDGCNYMSHIQWEEFCAKNNFNPKDPRTALNVSGIEWKPETFGSTCYKKEKSANKKTCVEIITDDGVKWLFI